MTRCMMSELCRADAENDEGAQVVGPTTSPGESIFQHGTRIGIADGISSDHWLHDSTSTTWTRMIMIAHRELYHPSEVRRKTAMGLGLTLLGIPG